MCKMDISFSVKSFVNLTRELLGVPGVEYILSGKFNQDPLENYFSKQRGICGRMDNPDILQFQQNIRRIHVSANARLESRHANCQAQPDQPMVDDNPLVRFR